MWTILFFSMRADPRVPAMRHTKGMSLRWRTFGGIISSSSRAKYPMGSNHSRLIEAI
jgi:hypothetical protein